MIIVKLAGGLGNQLFQYATGRALALTHGEPLRLDLSWFETQSKRGYALGAFRISGTPLDRDEALRLNRPFRASLPAKLWFRARQRFRRASELHYVVEQGPNDCDRVLRAGRNCFLVGHWQNEACFLHARPVLLEEFSSAQALPSSREAILQAIAGSESVAVHVRRGDYVADPQIHQKHGTCSPEYYQAASGLLQERLGNPKFFVFSDDLEWCRKSLSLPEGTVFVDTAPAGDEHWDLHLMSRCKHFIIANSSFSWWGAWLSRNAEKIVVAPCKWTNQHSFVTSGIVPEQWVRL